MSAFLAHGPRRSTAKGVWRYSVSRRRDVFPTWRIRSGVLPPVSRQRSEIRRAQDDVWGTVSGEAAARYGHGVSRALTKILPSRATSVERRGRGCRSPPRAVARNSVGDRHTHAHVLSFRSVLLPRVL